MKILKACKTELAPNNKQKTMLRQCAGTARFVYNWENSVQRECHVRTDF